MSGTFPHKTYLGVDYGAKVIGLALYRPDRDPFVLLYGRIVVKTEKQVMSEFSKIIQDENVDIIVLGLPLFTDGKESKMTTVVKLFGEKLISLNPSVQLFFQDETLTTFEAEERMKNSPKFNFRVDHKQVDSLCASVILEDFFSQKQYVEEP